MPKKRFLLVLLIGTCSLAAPRAHGLDPARALTQYVRDAWRTEEGLPQNTVAAIIQTRDGYIWLGTQEGLVRFDGVRFEVFNKKNTSAIRNNFMRVLAEDSEGTLWIGTNGSGLVRYRDGQFTSYSTKDGLSGDRVFAIAQGRDGALWVGTNAGLSSFQRGAWTSYAVADGLPGDSVLALLADQAGNLWAGTDKGLAVLRDGRIGGTSESLVAAGRVFSILEDRDQTLWVGTADGLLRLREGNVRRFTVEGGLPGRRILAIHQDRDGNLWIGTEGGLARMSGERIASLGSRDGLPDGQVLSLLEDREGSLWVGTGNGGLNRLKDGTFTPFGIPEGLPHEDVRTVYEDPDGSLWVGTDGGLARLTPGGFVNYTTSQGLSSNKVTALLTDRQGALWVGTYGGGVNRFADGRFVALGSETGLADKVVTAIAEDGEGAVWVGTAAGLSRWDGKRFETFTTRHGLSNDVILCMQRTREGTLLIGTYGGGLLRARDGGFDVFRTTDGLSSDLIVSLHEDREGVMWIGTLGGGLIRFADEEFFVYREDQGLFSDNVYQILEDDLGNLWMSSNLGISRVAKRELEDLRSGRITVLSPVSFGVSDGMRSAECTGGSQPAGWRSRAGQLWFPTIRGVVSIDPGRLRLNMIPPPVVIESVFVDGHPTAPRGGIELPPRIRNLEVRYTALSFVEPAKVRFKYKFEPYDTEWVDAGARRVAFQTNLSPGSYRFVVIASNDSGVWSTKQAALPFRVRPAFWQTRWFQATSLMIALLLVVSVHKAKTYAIKLRNRELESIVTERTDDLRRYARALEEHSHILESANIRVRSADRSKSKFLADMSHELRTPLNSIIGFSEILLQRSREHLEDPVVSRFLGNIRDSSEHLLSLINDLLDLSKIEAGRMEVFPEPADMRAVLEGVRSLMAGYSAKRSVGIEIRADPRLPRVNVDTSKVKQMLYNLTSNAVKFSPDGASVEIEARFLPSDESALDTDAFEVLVTDHGVGIPPEEQRAIFEEFRQVGGSARSPGGTGLGLALARRFAQLQGGSLDVESSPGRGSTFRLVLPTNVAPVASEVETAHDSSDMEGFHRTVLVVEGDREAFIHLARILEGEGLLPIRARRGQEALNMAKELRPSLIVLDLSLPGMDGWNALKAVKADPEIAHIPVVIVSVLESRELGLSLGAADFFIKPVDQERFARRIGDVIATARRG